MDDWGDLIALTGVPKEQVTQILEGWDLKDPPTRIASICRLVGPDARETSWLTAKTEAARLQAGIYSPLQLLAWECAIKRADSVELDFPFLFGWTSLVAATLISFGKELSTSAEWPPPEASTDEIRRLLQDVFRLREMREEHEPLSLEMHLPLPEDSSSPRVPLKRLAQVFGRGVAIVTGSELQSRHEAEGAVYHVFRDHELAPASRLYTLKGEYTRLDPGVLGLTLRRDGLVTIARQANPLLEFYDGGWHIVDLESGRIATKRMLDTRFSDPGVTVAPTLPALLVQLAYHMASHWHGGILAVVDESGLEETLHDPSDESKSVTAALTAIAGVTDPAHVRITEIESESPAKRGLGRLFLTLAIQDGATLFRPDGSFIGASRFVKDQETGEVPGGSGTRAARSLAKHGVAIKISADGGIRVFARSDSGKSVEWVPRDGRGLRIR